MGPLPAGGLGAQVRVIGIEDLAGAAFQQAAFDGAVVGEGAVAFQVVRGEGGPEANPRRHQGAGFNLIAAQFHHQPIGGRLAGSQALEGQLSRRVAHIAAHGGIEAGVAQQVVDQVGHGGFAIGARDADPGGGGQGLPGRRQFACHGHALVTQLLEGGVVPADPRADNHALNGLA